VGQGEGQVVAATAPAITTQYGPSPNNPFGTGILFVKTRDSNGQDTIAYYHHDHLNTPIQATDKQGKVVWAAQYSAFGQVTLTTPTATGENPVIESSLRFPGQVEDAETGLYYNWHRYYDPEIGRYVTQDPIGLQGGMNLYAYVGGNPVNLVDPEGLASCTFTFSTGRVVCVPANPQNNPVNIPAASGNNGGGQQCRNNPACTATRGRGPIPLGCWQWTTGTTGKPNGRVLVPCPGTNTNATENRTLIRSHSCANPFGPGLGPRYCSEGCVTGKVPDIQDLNRLIDAEPSSTLQVVP
jgi:RHS repeat-associated protein